MFKIDQVIPYISSTEDCFRFIIMVKTLIIAKIFSINSNIETIKNWHMGIVIQSNRSSNINKTVVTYWNKFCVK